MLYCSIIVSLKHKYLILEDMNSKKYLQKREDDLLHIGNLVAWIIQENHSKKKDVSKHYL